MILPVAFEPSTGEVTSFQFDIEYDPSVISLTAISGDTLRLAEKNLYFAPVAANRLRFLAAGLNRTPIPAGTVIEFYAHLAAAAPEGAYTLRITSVIFTTGEGEQVDAFITNGTIIVQGTGGAPLTTAGVLNAASLQPGPVAPGEIITLFGSAIGPPEPVESQATAPVSLRFNGLEAPVLYAGPNQINAVVPFGLGEQPSVELTLNRGDQPVAQLSLPLAAAAPGIFTIGFAGLGPGAIVNDDATVNSPDNPAGRGTVVAIYATGAGPTTPPSLDGQVPSEPLPRLALPVSVVIGGVPAEVLYAGAAPGFVAGVLQINCRIPPEVPPSVTAPIQLRAGEFSSPPGVSIAVR